VHHEGIVQWWYLASVYSYGCCEAGKLHAMKYLEDKNVQEVDMLLHRGIPVGDTTVHGMMELYSCKMAGTDKKVLGHVERQYGSEHYVEAENIAGGGGEPPSPVISQSPLGPMTHSATRKLLVNLILTMNHAFGDYDFSDVSPEAFVAEPAVMRVQSLVNSKFMKFNEESCSQFCHKLWQAVDSSIGLADSEIYSYIPNDDEDVFSSGKLWSLNYFLYNKKAKQLLFFSCWTKEVTRSSQDEEEEDDEFGEMDLDL